MPKRNKRKPNEAETKVTDLTVVGMKYLQEMQDTFDGAVDDIFDLLNLQAAINHFQKEVDSIIEDRKAEMKTKGMKELRDAVVKEGVYRYWRDFIIEFCIDDVPEDYLMQSLKRANEIQGRNDRYKENPFIRALADAGITDWTFKMEEFKDWQQSVKAILSEALDDAEELAWGK